MSGPAAELQTAIFDALRGDAGLAAIIGTRIFDHAPANVAFPYISFGRTSVYDWSTGTERGSEHLFTLHVWSKTKGKKETLDIMERAKTLLDDAALAMSAHHLVNLRLEFAEARFDEDLSLHHGLLRFRAMIEQVA